jgi:hypothetical protein
MLVTRIRAIALGASVHEEEDSRGRAATGAAFRPFTRKGARTS